MHKTNTNHIKLFILSWALINLLLPNIVLAQTTATYSGPEATITQLLCTPTPSSSTGNAASGDLYNCINKLYKFAIIIASIGGVLMVVIAGYMYMSAEGNQETVSSARGLITSTIVALAILFVGYVFLKALNPDLITFHTIAPPSGGTTGTTGGAGPTTPTSPATPAASGTSKAAAQQLLNLNGKSITIASSGSCSGNNPLANLQAIAAGNQAVADGPGTACNQGTTDIDPSLINALTSLANANLGVTVTSLTSGHHSSANDPHYAGEAVDIVPQNLATQSQSILTSLVSSGVAKVAVECNLAGVAQFIVIYPSSGSANASQCTSQPNYHWHAQWSGVSGNLGTEND